MTMAPVVTMSRSPPAIARVGVSAPVVLAICVRIKLGALARISDYVLRRRRAGTCGWNDKATAPNRIVGLVIAISLVIVCDFNGDGS